MIDHCFGLIAAQRQRKMRQLYLNSSLAVLMCLKLCAFAGISVFRAIKHTKRGVGYLSQIEHVKRPVKLMQGLQAAFFNTAVVRPLSACTHAQHLDCPEFQALLNEVLPQQQ